MKSSSLKGMLALALSGAAFAAGIGSGIGSTSRLTLTSDGRSRGGQLRRYRNPYGDYRRSTPRSGDKLARKAAKGRVGMATLR